MNERETIARIEAEARRYAEMYPQSSDGRNTFIIFADWVAALPAHGPAQLPAGEVEHSCQCGKGSEPCPGPDGVPLCVYAPDDSGQARSGVQTPDAWQPIETAPLDPLRDPPLVMLWVDDGGHQGKGTHAFGRCYRSHDGTVRGVASGFSGNWSIRYWQPLPAGPSSRLPSAERGSK